MIALAILLGVLAAAWVAIGVGLLVRPAAKPGLTTLRRLRGSLLTVGGAALGVAAVAVARR